MMYYKSTAEMTDHFTGWTVIMDELVTERERNTRFRYLPDYIFKKVYISQRDTHKSFGIRFENKERNRKTDRAFMETLMSAANEATI